LAPGRANAVRVPPLDRLQTIVIDARFALRDVAVAAVAEQDDGYRFGESPIGSKRFSPSGSTAPLTGV
jgi:hypothetical protein